MTRKPTPGLAIVHRDSADFAALVALRGRRPFVGRRGTITVSITELHEARRMAAAREAITRPVRRWWD